MNKNEFALFTAALKTYYPRENLLPNNQALGLWYDMLHDIPYKAAEAILQKWVATNKWSPTIADIREMAAELQTDGGTADWGDAWEQVIRAIGRYGYYQAEEAMASFDPLTRQCVERLGFRNICLSENITADRASFRMLYEQLADRKKKNAQVPANVQNLLDGIHIIAIGDGGI